MAVLAPSYQMPLFHRDHSIPIDFSVSSGPDASWILSHLTGSIEDGLIVPHYLLECHSRSRHGFGNSGAAVHSPAMCKIYTKYDLIRGRKLQTVYRGCLDLVQTRPDKSSGAVHWSPVASPLENDGEHNSSVTPAWISEEDLVIALQGQGLRRSDQLGAAPLALSAATYWALIKVLSEWKSGVHRCMLPKEIAADMQSLIGCDFSGKHVTTALKTSGATTPITYNASEGIGTRLAAPLWRDYARVLYHRFCTLPSHATFLWQAAVDSTRYAYLSHSRSDLESSGCKSVEIKLCGGAITSEARGCVARNDERWRRGDILDGTARLISIFHLPLMDEQVDTRREAIVLGERLEKENEGEELRTITRAWLRSAIAFHHIYAFRPYTRHLHLDNFPAPAPLAIFCLLPRTTGHLERRVRGVGRQRRWDGNTCEVESVDVRWSTEGAYRK
ncbi:hypothetical protein GLOTRDRAFT_97356, partial [Gloeophyllum trabeum ATCC 11539]